MLLFYRNRWFQILLAQGLLLSLPLCGQQAVAVPPAASSEANTKDEIQALKAQLSEQQRQLEQLQALMQKQQDAISKAAKQIDDAEQARRKAPESLGEVASIRPILPMPAVATPLNPGTSALGAQRAAGVGSESPVSFRIGGANFTPVGFVDFINLTRSSNVGSSVGTSFNSIPYSNSVFGNLTENRSSMQNSRIGLRVDSTVGSYKVLGYLESDFLGNAPSNLFVTSNSDTLRLRLYFVDLKKDKFELLAGQSWSLMTPNRKGLSPMPSDLFYTQDIDTNYQVGLVWSRDPGVRFVWNPNKNVSWGFAAENAEQYIGASGVVVFPAKLSSSATGIGSTFPTQLDNGSATNTPNLHPDFITKIAFDGSPGGHSAHFEVAGMFRTFKTYNPLTAEHHATVGGGGSVNFNFELVKNLRLVSNNFFSEGGGRYIFGLGPDVAIRPDGSPALVRASSTVDGLELQASKNTVIYAYYGGAYYGRSTFIDEDGKEVGYGIRGGSNNANRAIQEVSFGFANNFWKSPQFGALTLAMQYSYVTRSPWSIIDPTLPKNANLHMGYVNLRYTLP